jgi:serine/threonine protein kinase
LFVTDKVVPRDDADRADDLDRVFRDGDLFLNSYRLEHVLGRGGESLVFEAVHLETGQRVALKIARRLPHHAGNRLLREADFLRRFEHLNIIKVLASGRDECGDAYCALELIVGQALHRRLREGPLAVRDSIAVVHAVASALTAVHTAQVVHRDIKPRNILIPARDGRLAFDQAVLIDFGLMSPLSEQATNGRAYTVFGRASGTARYMAPEQLLGRRQSVATDIYGLGALAFEVLYGAAPQSGKTPIIRYRLAVPGDELRVYLPQTIGPVTIPECPDIPTALRELVGSLLSAKPEQRPATALDVSNALRAIDAGLAENGVPTGMTNMVQPPRA